MLGPKRAKRVHPLSSGSVVKTFWNFAQWKGLISTWKFYLFFKKKIKMGQFDLFRPFFTVWLGMIEIEQSHCNCSILKQSEHDFFHDCYWNLKQSGHDFSGKHLRDGHCMSIMWCLSVEVKIQQRLLWFCKASLRICHVILFECKGPWTLKTDSLIF